MMTKAEFFRILVTLVCFWTQSAWSAEEDLLSKAIARAHTSKMQLESGLTFRNVMDAEKSLRALQPYLPTAPVRVSPALRELVTTLYTTAEAPYADRVTEIWSHLGIIALIIGPDDLWIDAKNAGDDAAIERLATEHFSRIADWTSGLRKQVNPSFRDIHPKFPEVPKSVISPPMPPTLPLPSSIPDENERKVYEAEYDAFMAWRKEDARQNTLPVTIHVNETAIARAIAASRCKVVANAGFLKQMLARCGSSPDTIAELLTTHLPEP